MQSKSNKMGELLNICEVNIFWKNVEYIRILYIHEIYYFDIKNFRNERECNIEYELFFIIFSLFRLSLNISNT